MNNIRYITTKLDEKIDEYINNLIDNKTIKENHIKIKNELKMNLDKFKLSKAIVTKLFLIFDKIYFKNLIQDKLHNNNINLSFGISNKYKNVAGMCIYHRNNMEIIFSNYIITKIYDSKFKSIAINGLLCYDIVDVMINLMEHEITHLILFIYDRYKDDVKSGHNSQFKDIVYNMYGHTKITHDLLTGDIEEYNKCKDKACDEVKIGMKIECGKNSGIVVDIKNRYLLYKDNDKIKSCKFNEYKIIDSNYKEYQDYIKKLKEKLEIGTEVKCGKLYGPITKIINDKVYFKDEMSNRIYWCLINFIEKSN